MFRFLFLVSLSLAIPTAKAALLMQGGYHFYNQGGQSFEDPPDLSLSGQVIIRNNDVAGMTVILGEGQPGLRTSTAGQVYTITSDLWLATLLFAHPQTRIAMRFNPYGTGEDVYVQDVWTSPLFQGFVPQLGVGLSGYEVSLVTFSFVLTVLEPFLDRPGDWWWEGDVTVSIYGDLAPVYPPLLGDYNQSGTVDAADYVTWRNAMGTQVMLPNVLGSPHLAVGYDYAIWRMHFGESSVPPVGAASIVGAVPEPSAWTLTAIGACALLRRRLVGQSRATM